LACIGDFVYGQPMIEFWIAAALLSAIAAALVLYRAARLARRPATDPTVDVYRRQLSEIDELADRGLLVDAERTAARAEAARRLLGAADEARADVATPPPSRAVRLWVILAAAAAPLAAAGVYMVLGSPGAPDQPFAARLKTWRSASDPTQLTAPELAAVLSEVVKSRPGDVEGRLLLARAQAAAGDLPSATQTLKSTSRLAPDNADVWQMLGEALVEQAQGQETPSAVLAFRKAVALNPQDGSAHYHLGRAQIMNGDLNGGLAEWRALEAHLPTGEAAQALQAQIDATQRAGRLVENASGQDRQPAQASAAGPSDSQVQAAEQAQVGAAPADRRAFIESMVSQMAAKLKADPHNLQGWSLLIRSYGVLGEADKQAQALAQARVLFKGDAAAQKTINDASAGTP
jgi:cytochrome c-type biogenesis protein CcmH